MLEIAAIFCHNGISDDGKCEPGVGRISREVRSSMMLGGYPLFGSLTIPKEHRPDEVRKKAL